MLLVVREASQTVLAPVIGAGARLIMAEVVPGIAIVAVVFAHRAPLALAEVGPPFAPQDATLPRLREALHLGSGLFDGASLCVHLITPFCADLKLVAVHSPLLTSPSGSCASSRPARVACMRILWSRSL